MEKILRKYELVIIVDAKSTNEAKEAICKETTDLVIKCGGKVVNTQVWLEKHKMTFRIKNCNEGTYYLINFEGESDVIAKMKIDLRLNEKILRYAFIKVEPKAKSKTVQAAVAA